MEFSLRAESSPMSGCDSVAEGRRLNNFRTPSRVDDGASLALFGSESCVECDQRWKLGRKSFLFAATNDSPKDVARRKEPRGISAGAVLSS